VYAWQTSNTLSILHRITGVFLAIGAIALVGWLVSVVVGPEAYARVNGFFAGPIGALLIFGWTFCFFYHLANGVRHLFWDAGYGFDKQLARRTGWLTVGFAVLVTLGVWAAIMAA